MWVDNQEAINCYRKEKEARTAAEKVGNEKSAELEKVRDEKSVAEKKVIVSYVLDKLVINY